MDYKMWELRMQWTMLLERNQELDLLRRTLDNVDWRPQISGLLLFLTLRMHETVQDPNSIIIKFMEITPLFHHNTIIWCYSNPHTGMIETELYCSKNVSKLKEQSTLDAVLQHLTQDPCPLQP